MGDDFKDLVKRTEAHRRDAEDMALAWRAYQAAWKDMEAGVRAKDPRVVMAKVDVQR